MWCYFSPLREVREKFIKGFEPTSEKWKESSHKDTLKTIRNLVKDGRVHKAPYKYYYNFVNLGGVRVVESHVPRMSYSSGKTFDSTLGNYFPKLKDSLFQATRHKYHLFFEVFGAGAGKFCETKHLEACYHIVKLIESDEYLLVIHDDRIAETLPDDSYYYNSVFDAAFFNYTLVKNDEYTKNVLALMGINVDEEMSNRLKYELYVMAYYGIIMNNSKAKL